MKIPRSRLMGIANRALSMSRHPSASAQTRIIQYNKMDVIAELLGIERDQLIVKLAEERENAVEA